LKRPEGESRFADNGCKAATAYLKAQSHCLECPFAECLEMGKNRNAWSENKRLSNLQPAQKGDVRNPHGRPKSVAAEERRQWIRKLHGQGKTNIQIARIVAVDRSYVCMVLRGTA
jgi:hypothetical protein